MNGTHSLRSVARALCGTKRDRTLSSGLYVRTSRTIEPVIPAERMRTWSASARWRADYGHLQSRADEGVMRMFARLSESRLGNWPADLLSGEREY